MKPIGRERDREIAEVKGWSVKPTKLEFDIMYKEGEKGVLACPHYSTSIPAAWELEKEFLQEGLTYHCKIFKGCNGYVCICSLGKRGNMGFGGSWEFKGVESAWHETPEAAKCDAVTQAWLEWKKGVK